MATTTNYGWTKPTVGGDTGAWGTLLNAIFDAVDTALFAVSGVANAALPKAGGVMTGRLDLKTSARTKTDMGGVSGNPVNLDCSAAQVITATLGGVTTFAFTNVPANASGVVLVLTNGGSAAITWPASVKWASGSAPALTAAGVDVLAFVTTDGGTTWRGVLSSKDSRQVLDEFMLALVSTPGGGLVPSLNAVSVSSQTGGACNPSGGLTIAAKVFIGWTITNPNDTDYTVKVYENGVYLQSGNTSDAGSTKTVSGSVESGVPHENPSGEWTSNWTYRVDLVRLSDGVAVQTLTTSNWAQRYGVCL